MSWLEGLRPASFRGVPFGVSASGHGFGRHTVVHEIPKKEDGAYVEDMGKRSATFSITAFVVGEDVFDRRDALQAALEQKGPGTLVHPHYGEREVCVAGEVECSEGLEVGGRVAVFDIPFVEVGEQRAAPSSSLHMPSLARGRVDAAARTTSQWLTRSLKLVSSDAKEETARELSGGIRRVADVLHGENSGVFQDVASSGGLVPIDTGEIFHALDGGTRGKAVGEVAYDLIRRAATQARETGTTLDAQTGALVEWVVRGGLSGTASPFLGDGAAGAGSLAGTSRQAIRDNALYVRGALVEWAVAEICLSCALLFPESKKQAAIIRQRVIQAVDAALLAMKHDEGYGAYTHLRTTAVAALAQNAGLAPEVGRVDLGRSFPAFTVLYGATGSIKNYEDFLRRNGARHPAFIPPGAVEVLYA